MAKKNYTTINTVLYNDVYYQPGDTIELPEDEARSLLDGGVIEDHNPERKENYDEKKKPAPPYKNDLTELKGVGGETEAMINNMGITNFTGLAGANIEAIAAIPGLSDRKAKDIIKQAARLAKKYKK